VRREDEAKAVLSRLQGGEDFAKVAREVSVDATAAAGGELGWRTQKQLEQYFDVAGARDLLELASKGTHQLLILRSTRGYHVILPTAYRAPGEGSYEDAQESVLDDCLRERRRAVIEELSKELRAKAAITIDEAKVASVEILPGRPAAHGGGMGGPGSAPQGGGVSPHGGGMGVPGGGGASPHGGGMGVPGGSGGASPHGGMGVPGGGSRPPGHP
jgi:hypothetical protein